MIFAQDLESVIKFLNTLPSWLKSLNDIIPTHFFGNSHWFVELIKSCKLLYLDKYVISIWLTWLKYNYEYTCFKHVTWQWYIKTSE
jgi:hypothetical protein